LKTFGSEDDIEDRDFDESSATARGRNALYLQKMQLEFFLSIDLLQLPQSDSFDPQTLEQKQQIVFHFCPRMIL
jgi:hypothetical protein